MVEHIPAALHAGEIEETVMGEVDDRRTVRHRLERDREGSIARQRVCDARAQRSGKAPLPVGTGKGERSQGRRAVVERLDAPQLAVEPVRTAVKAVRPIVGWKLDAS